jgi:hypothetical protein
VAALCDEFGRYCVSVNLAPSFKRVVNQAVGNV